jgi:hypothetical protein
MAKTLRERIADDVTTVFLQEDRFASRDEYKPLVGGQREVAGVAEELVDAALDDETGDEVHTERIRYWTSRLDAKNGICNPQIGDQLVLSKDSDWESYTFTGEIPERDADSWWLVFSRPRRTGRGVRK